MSPAGSKVVVWRTELLPGSETFIRNQVINLAGWEPILLGAERRDSPLSSANDRLLFDGLKGAAVRVWMLYRLGGSARLHAALRRAQPSIIHAHFANDGWVIARSATSLRVPLIVTLHGQDVTRWPNQTGLRGAIARRKIRRLFARSDLLVAVSEFIRTQAIILGADPAKVVVHHIGIPISQPVQHREPARDVLFVGRLVEKKGINDLLRAVQMAGESLGRPIRVGIIGDGPLRSDLEEIARQHNVLAEFLGARTAAEIREELAQSRLFVGPSKRAANGDSEGFGMVFLEAAAAGRPVVSYRHGGVVEAVVDGTTGLLADEGDVTGLAAHIQRLLSNAEERAAMGAAGRERVVRDFDVVKQTNELERLYDHVVQHHAERRGVRG